MSGIVGVKTVIWQYVRRVPFGYERHLLTQRWMLKATKGWRHMGPDKRAVEHARGRRPADWKSGITETFKPA